MTIKLTPAQTKALGNLPECFMIREDYSRSDCPPTEVLDLDGGVIGRINARTYQGLLRAGAIVRMERHSSANDPSNINLSSYMRAS